MWQINQKGVIFSLLFIILIFQFPLIMASGIPDVPGKNKPEEIPVPKKNRIQDKIKPETPVVYQFSNNKRFGASSNVEVQLYVEYEDAIHDREISVRIENNRAISLSVIARTNLSKFDSSMKLNPPDNINQQWDYGCVYQFKANATIESLIFSFNKSFFYDLDPDKSYAIAVLEFGQDTWNLLSIKESSTQLKVIQLLDSSDDSNPSNILTGTLQNMEENKEYYITIFEMEEAKISREVISWIVILIIGILSTIILISKKEYLNLIKKRLTPIGTGTHRLTLEEVLENENRNKIIEFILEHPGIHFNELLRKTELSPGNLVWHLDILETYKIIGKRRIGNFLAYFPYYQKNPLSNLDLQLKKSKLTLEILELIEESPGIWNIILTNKLKVDHKTIHYHVKKLLELGLITIKKEGRKKKLYPNLDSDYFKNHRGINNNEK